MRALTRLIRQTCSGKSDDVFEGDSIRGKRGEPNMKTRYSQLKRSNRAMRLVGIFVATILLVNGWILPSVLPKASIFAEDIATHGTARVTTNPPANTTATTMTTLTSFPNPSKLGASVTFTATVTSSGGNGTPGFWQSGTGDEFYVTPDGAHVKRFAIYVSVSGCGTYKITKLIESPITDNQFSASGAFYYNGTFDSPTSAHGTDGLSSFYISGCGYVTGGPFSWNATWKNSTQPTLTVHGPVQDNVETIIATGSSREVVRVESSNLQPSTNPSPFPSIRSRSAGTPTGTVTFKDGTTTLGTGTLNGSGQATYSTSSLTIGSHNITAQYSGDGTFSGSTSSILTQVVRPSKISLPLPLLLLN
jgi:hypothetical protein